MFVPSVLVVDFGQEEPKAASYVREDDYNHREGNELTLLLAHFEVVEDLLRYLILGELFFDAGQSEELQDFEQFGQFGQEEVRSFHLHEVVVGEGGKQVEP